MKKTYLTLLLLPFVFLLSFKPKTIKTEYTFIDLQENFQYDLSEEQLVIKCYNVNEENPSEDITYQLSEPQFRRLRLPFLIAERKKASHINGRFRDSAFILIKDEGEPERSYTLRRDCDEHLKLQETFNTVVGQVSKNKYKKQC